MYRRNSSGCVYIFLVMFLIGDIYVFIEYLNGSIPLRGLLIVLAVPVITAVVFLGRWIISTGIIALMSAPVYLLGFVMSSIDKIRKSKKS